MTSDAAVTATLCGKHHGCQAALNANTFAPRRNWSR